MMKLYKDGDYVATHKNPVWRDKANFIVMASIDSEENNNEWEQIWGMKTSVDSILICCIPFFAYDISLGDEVRLDSNNCIKDTIKKSGMYVYRIWFGESNSSQLSQYEVMEFIDSNNILFECSSENLLAICAKDKEEASVIERYLVPMHESGKLIYEKAFNDFLP